MQHTCIIVALPISFPALTGNQYCLSLLALSTLFKKVCALKILFLKALVQKVKNMYVQPKVIQRINNMLSNVFVISSS